MNLPAKDPAEFVIVTFDYEHEIGDATVSSAALSCAVKSGADADVGSMLYGAAVVSGADVLQLVRLGVDGADYTLRCLATLSDGRKLLRWATLPVRTGA